MVDAPEGTVRPHGSIVSTLGSVHRHDLKKTTLAVGFVAGELVVRKSTQFFGWISLQAGRQFRPRTILLHHRPHSLSCTADEQCHNQQQCLGAKGYQTICKTQNQWSTFESVIFLHPQKFCQFVYVHLPRWERCWWYCR